MYIRRNRNILHDSKEMMIRFGVVVGLGLIVYLSFYNLGDIEEDPIQAM
jgi:hypothetical protein